MKPSLIPLLIAAMAGAVHAENRHPRGFNGRIAPRLRALPAPPPSGELEIVVTNLREKVHLNLFNLDGTFNAQSLRLLANAFRCKRTGDQRPIHPHLLEVLSHVYDRYKTRIHLLSGYRNQENTYSYHYRGSAADIRVPGVSIRALRRFVESLDTGFMGVGLYPRSKFVHVDVRPPPSYRWVDTRPTGARMQATRGRRHRPDS